MGTVRKIIFVIALIVLLISGYKLGSYFWNAHKKESESCIRCKEAEE